MVNLELYSLAVKTHPHWWGLQEDILHTKVEAKLRTLVERNEVRHLLIPRFGDVLSKAIVEIYWSSTDNESWPDEAELWLQYCVLREVKSSFLVREVSKRPPINSWEDLCSLIKAQADTVENAIVDLWELRREKFFIAKSLSNLSSSICLHECDIVILERYFLFTDVLGILVDKRNGVMCIDKYSRLMDFRSELEEKYSEKLALVEPHMKGLWCYTPVSTKEMMSFEKEE